MLTEQGLVIKQESRLVTLIRRSVVVFSRTKCIATEHPVLRDISTSMYKKAAPTQLLAGYRSGFIGYPLAANGL